MKLVAALLVSALFVSIAHGAKKCKIERGLELEMYSGSTLKMKVPCKYNMIQQKCGDYKVTVTPSGRYLPPSYIIDSVWLTVQDASSLEVLWQGRTTTKLTALHIITNGTREAFNKRNGSMATNELFTLKTSSKDVTLKAKGIGFELQFGVYDFSAKRHDDSFLSFACDEAPEQVPYPVQFCGSNDPKIMRDHIDEIFGNNKRSDLMTLFDIFNDTSIVQVDEKCIQATSTLTTVCKTDDDRKKAIRACHLILDENGHTECVVRKSCDPMDTFVNCLDFVCQGYNKTVPSCEAVGKAIDMCRDFPGLTEKVKKANCYTDLFTAEDNPFNNKKTKTD